MDDLDRCSCERDLLPVFDDVCEELVEGEMVTVWGAVSEPRLRDAVMDCSCDHEREAVELSFVPEVLTDCASDMEDDDVNDLGGCEIVLEKDIDKPSPEGLAEVLSDMSNVAE